MISTLINRARWHWQVLSTVLFGVLVSTAFLASGPLNLIAALDQPTKGEIRVGNLSVTDMTGSEITQYRRKQISFIYQTIGLLPYLTVEENVEVPLRLVNTPRKKRQEQVADALTRLS